MRVKKYNKKTEDFDKEKIAESIRLASKATEEENIPDFMAIRIADNIESELLKNNTKIVSAESISDMVENRLMQTAYKEIAKSYITYHYDRQKDHFRNSEMMKAFKKKLKAAEVENSNANCDEKSFSGRMNEAARVLYKDDALETMSKVHKNNHNNNEVYTHDLDSYSSGMHNCLSIPIDNMNRDGVHIKQTDIRGSRSISTFMQLLAVYMQVQSLQQFGGVAYTHVDWSAIPSVRWSFFKHLKDGHKYILKEKWKMPDDCENISIDDYKDDPCYEYALDMTLRETRQGAEALIHNLNSLQSRSGQQLPFSSINYGTCTLTEGRMVTSAILDATLDGTGPLHKTPIFPCGIFQVEESINLRPGTPNYDLFRKALYCTTKRFYPNYCNVNWSVDISGRNKDVEHKRSAIAKLSADKLDKITSWVKENPTEARHYKMVIKDDQLVIDDTIVDPVEIMSTMGCRTYNGYDANFDFNYVFDNIIKYNKPPKDYFYSGNQKDGRGNIAPATVILPTLAMKAKGRIGKKNVEHFFEILNQKIEECKDSLVERFSLIASQSPASATFMYSNRTMLGYIPEEGIISALKHGTLAIGQIGMAETLQILIGKDQTDPEGMELAERIEKLFNSRCAEYKNATYAIKNFYTGDILAENIHLNIGVYYTPAESLCHTALKKFRDKYGVIPNVSDKEFFTNSIHVPVWYDITPFEKIDIESRLTKYSNAGCITYVEIESSASHNIDAIETLVVQAMEKDIPYLGINLSLDTCRDCGWSGEIGNECPACKSTSIQRLRRVTGYITEDYLTAFNDGKIDEVGHRKKHHGTVDDVNKATVLYKAIRESCTNC